MENNKPFGYVFDLDTTINENNEINTDAINLLKEITKTQENAPVMFISKFNVKETQKVVDAIEERVGKYKMRSIVCSNNGAYITNGKVGVKNRLDINQIKDIRQKVETYAPGSIIIYKTKDHNYREQITRAKTFKAKVRKGLTLLFNPMLKKYKKYKIFSKPFSQKMLDSFAKNEQILSIEVIAPKKKLPLLKRRMAYIENTSINIDGSLNITNVSKWDAVKTVFKNNSKDVVFFGKNPTDKECMLECKNVICPNTKNPRLVREIINQQRLGRHMYAINGYNHKDLLDFIDRKRSSVARLKFDTRCIYSKLSKPDRNMFCI